MQSKAYLRSLQYNITNNAIFKWIHGYSKKLAKYAGFIYLFVKTDIQTVKLGLRQWE